MARPNGSGPDPLRRLQEDGPTVGAWHINALPNRPICKRANGHLSTDRPAKLTMRQSTIFYRGGARGDAFCAKIFIEFLPMHTVTVTANFKGGAILGLGLQQTGIPFQWIADDAPVAES